MCDLRVTSSVKLLKMRTAITRWYTLLSMYGIRNGCMDFGWYGYGFWMVYTPLFMYGIRHSVYGTRHSVYGTRHCLCMVYRTSLCVWYTSLCVWYTSLCVWYTSLCAWYTSLSMYAQAGSTCHTVWYIQLCHCMLHVTLYGTRYSLFVECVVRCVHESDEPQVCAATSQVTSCPVTESVPLDLIELEASPLSETRWPEPYGLIRNHGIFGLMQTSMLHPLKKKKKKRKKKAANYRAVPFTGAWRENSTRRLRASLWPSATDNAIVSLAMQLPRLAVGCSTCKWTGDRYVTSPSRQKCCTQSEQYLSASRYWKPAADSAVGSWLTKCPKQCSSLQPCINTVASPSKCHRLYASRTSLSINLRVINVL